MRRNTPRFAVVALSLAVPSILGLALCAGTDGIQNEGVKVTFKPATVYIERSETGQHLNFDFLIENRTDQELVLTGIELSAFDDRGRLTRRDFINRFSRASLELVPRRSLRPKQIGLVFNPFHTFPGSLPLKKLRYEFAFASEDEKVRYKSAVDVAPVLYQTKTDLALPLKGRVLVWDGHDYHSHHRRFDYTLPIFRRRGLTTNFMRYGYDFVLVNEQGVMYRGKPKDSEDWYLRNANDNGDYFAFGEPVYATGAGRIAAAHDGEPDDRRVNEGELARRETAMVGNYVVIDHMNANTASQLGIDD